MVTILVVIIALSIIILFHEGGHFVFSKLSKIKVEEFGLGYPPRAIGLAKIKNNNKWRLFLGKNIPVDTNPQSTIYSLNWVPFGGFNKIKGEEGESNDPDSFYTKSKIKRFFSIAGGVIMNIILAIILFSICFMIGMPAAVDQAELNKYAKVKETGVQIIGVQKNSPANQAGIAPGSFLISVDQIKIDSLNDFSDYTRDKVDQEINLRIKTNNQEKELILIPVKASDLFAQEELGDNNLERGVIGITLAETKIISYPLLIALWQGTKTTFLTFGKIVEGVYLIFKELFVRQRMIGEAVGVVGIATFIGDAYQIGFVYLLQFLGLISVAIAVTQLLPIPALDGGRLLFLFIEIIRRKPVSHQIEAKIHTIGFFVLLLLMVFITYKDLLRLGDRFLK